MTAKPKAPQAACKMTKAKRRGHSTQAPGQFYGYSIQTTRMVARLLQCTHGQAVSLEVLDDVAVTGGSGTVAEQTKSGLAHNPVSDRSVDLWKTLFNWVNAIRAGALTAETKFVLYVAQPYSGAIVERLHSIHRPEEAGATIAALRDEFWGVGPKRTKKKTLPDTIAKYVNAVLGASDDMLSRLIASLEFSTGTGSPVDDLVPLLRDKAAIGDGAVDDVLNALLGWTKKRVEKLIEAGKPPIIAWDEFHPQLIAAARRFDRSEILAPSPVQITEPEVEVELQSRHYVQQLRWIACAEADQVQAVNDYLRSSIDRTTWSERADVLESSFEEFSERLVRHWSHRRRLAGIELPGRNETQLGQAVLSHCLMATVQLQGLEVPSYFVPGSYHALADTFAVGWHPRYEEFRRPSLVPGGTATDGDIEGEDA